MNEGGTPNHRVDQKVENMMRLLLAFEEAAEDLENDADNSQTIANYQSQYLMEHTIKEFSTVLKVRIPDLKSLFHWSAEIDKSVIMNNSGRTRVQELDVDEVSVIPTRLLSKSEKPRSLEAKVGLVPGLLYKPTKSTAVPVNLLLSEDDKAIQLVIIELVPSSSGGLFSWFKVQKARRGRVDDNADDVLSLSKIELIRVRLREASESISSGKWQAESRAGGELQVHDERPLARGVHAHADSDKDQH